MSMTVINPGQGQVGQVPQVQHYNAAANVVTFPPVAQQTQPQNNVDKYKQYPRTQSVITGAIRVIFVVITIILDLIASNNGSTLMHMGYMSLWTGACLLASGILGIVSGVKTIQPVVVGHMTVSIISCSLFAPTQIICGGIAWGVDQFASIYDDPRPSSYAAAITVLALAQFVLNIWGSALGCSAECCGAPSPPQTISTAYVVQTGPNGTTMIPLGQNVSVTQPVPTYTSPNVQPMAPPPYHSVPPPAVTATAPAGPATGDDSYLDMGSGDYLQPEADEAEYSYIDTPARHPAEQQQNQVEGDYESLQCENNYQRLQNTK